jgi:DNA-binding CsgD family transcriptional regulator
MQGLEEQVVAEALYAIGEINLRRGELGAAEDRFVRAHEMGRDPQPGLAALRLAQGKIDAAVTGLRLSLASADEPIQPRARLLAAQVEGLDRGAGRARRSRTRKGAGEARLRGAERVVGGDGGNGPRLASPRRGQVDQALGCARRAWSQWQHLKLPYLAAKARMVIGLACKLAGDMDSAQIEFVSARAAFEQLGASLDARAAAERLRDATDLPGGLSARELEVLRLVAAGKTNREIAAAMVISEHTVSRHLENIFRKLEVSSRAGATAFAFKHLLV